MNEKLIKDVTTVIGDEMMKYVGKTYYKKNAWDLKDGGKKYYHYIENKIIDFQVIIDKDDIDIRFYTDDSPVYGDIALENKPQILQMKYKDIRWTIDKPDDYRTSDDAIDEIINDHPGVNLSNNEIIMHMIYSYRHKLIINSTETY